MWVRAAEEDEVMFADPRALRSPSVMIANCLYCWKKHVLFGDTCGLKAPKVPRLSQLAEPDPRYLITEVLARINIVDRLPIHS
jgi:hypothetical protein